MVVMLDFYFAHRHLSFSSILFVFLEKPHEVLLLLIVLEATMTEFR